MFKGKLQEIFTKEALKSSFNLINPKSFGIDGISFEEFSLNLEKNIEQILFDIHSNKYLPEPIKKLIDKKNDSFRIYFINEKSFTLTKENPPFTSNSMIV